MVTNSLKKILIVSTVKIELLLEKSGLWGFRPGLTQTELTSTEDDSKLEILDLGRRKIVLSEEPKQGADKLCPYCEADLRLCFRTGKNLFFS